MTYTRNGLYSWKRSFSDRLLFPFIYASLSKTCWTFYNSTCFHVLCIVMEFSGITACECFIEGRVLFQTLSFRPQGDQERLNTMKISPLMDREKPGITKSQVGFFDIVAMPLFRSFSSMFPDCGPMVKAVEDNFKMWQEMEPPQLSPKT